MIITSICKKNTDKKDANVKRGDICYAYDIYIDNSYAFSVTEEDYFKLNLYDKKEITEEELNILKKVTDFSIAKTRALTYLSYKIRTAKEIENKLLKEGFNSDIISKVIKDLVSDGYINDMLYVRKYIYDRNKLNPKSKRMLAYELKNKGIDDDLINEGLSELKIDNILIAKDLVLKKYKELDVSDAKVKRKIFLFLKYRGFTDNEIKNVINEIADEITDDMENY